MITSLEDKTWLDRNVFHKIPFLYKICPDGNRHVAWQRMCYCLNHKHCGEEGGVYDFKMNVWVKGGTIKDGSQIIKKKTVRDKIGRAWRYLFARKMASHLHQGRRLWLYEWQKIPSDYRWT
jgi:hypothetical protein